MRRMIKTTKLKVFVGELAMVTKHWEGQIDPELFRIQHLKAYMSARGSKPSILCVYFQ